MTRNVRVSGMLRCSHLLNRRHKFPTFDSTSSTEMAERVKFPQPGRRDLKTDQFTYNACHVIYESRSLAGGLVGVGCWHSTPHPFIPYHDNVFAHHHPHYCIYSSPNGSDGVCHRGPSYSGKPSPSRYSARGHDTLIGVWGVCHQDP
jgi:hypothetical protein